MERLEKLFPSFQLDPNAPPPLANARRMAQQGAVSPGTPRPKASTPPPLPPGVNLEFLKYIRTLKPTRTSGNSEASSGESSRPASPGGSSGATSGVSSGATSTGGSPQPKVAGKRKKQMKPSLARSYNNGETVTINGESVTKLSGPTVSPPGAPPTASAPTTPPSTPPKATRPTIASAPTTPPKATLPGAPTTASAPTTPLNTPHKATPPPTASAPTTPPKADPVTAALTKILSDDPAPTTGPTVDTSIDAVDASLKEKSQPQNPSLLNQTRNLNPSQTMQRKEKPQSGSIWSTVDFLHKVTAQREQRRREQEQRPPPEPPFTPPPSGGKKMRLETIPDPDNQGRTKLVYTEIDPTPPPPSDGTTPFSTIEINDDGTFQRYDENGNRY